MEKVKLGDDYASKIVEISPADLKEIAQKMEDRAKFSNGGDSIIFPISNSVTLVYNIPINNSEVKKLETERERILS